MILLIILFFVVGIVAIMFETLLPFGISAIFGFALIGASAYVAYLEFGINLAILYCLMSLSVAFLVTRLVFRSGLRWLTLKPPRPETPAAGVAPVSEADPRPGDAARVVAPLRPTGTVDCQGRRMPARCVLPEQEIPIGAEVRLVSKDSIYWIVERAESGAVRGYEGAPPSV